jgi:hypothetical protein
MSATVWGLVGVAYLALIVAVLGGLHWTRRSLLDRLDTPAAHRDWEAWRTEAQRQAEGEGPIQRRVPKSPEPPTLVLLRDYYGICVAGAWLFTTLLFAVLVFVVRGILGAARVSRSPGEKGVVR